MKIEHTILMLAKDGSAQATYTNVLWYEGLYGCLTVLHLSDGETATFNKDEWDMYDLTPTAGWNDRATDLPAHSGTIE